MNKATQTKDSLLLRPIATACGQGSDVAEKNLPSTDTRLYSVCKFNDLFLAFSAGACSVAIVVIAVLTYSGAATCN